MEPQACRRRSTKPELQIDGISMDMGTQDSTSSSVGSPDSTTADIPTAELSKAANVEPKQESYGYGSFKLMYALAMLLLFLPAILQLCYLNQETVKASEAINSGRKAWNSLLQAVGDAAGVKPLATNPPSNEVYPRSKKLYQELMKEESGAALDSIAPVGKSVHFNKSANPRKLDSVAFTIRVVRHDYFGTPERTVVYNQHNQVLYFTGSEGGKTELLLKMGGERLPAKNLKTGQIIDASGAIEADPGVIASMWEEFAAPYYEGDFAEIPSRVNIPMFVMERFGINQDVPAFSATSINLLVVLVDVCHATLLTKTKSQIQAVLEGTDESLKETFGICSGNPHFLSGTTVLDMTDLGGGDVCPDRWGDLENTWDKVREKLLGRGTYGDLSAYTHKVLILSASYQQSVTSAEYAGTVSWIQEPYAETVAVYMHALGHNMHLHNAGSIAVGGSGGSGDTIEWEYGDTSDVMGMCCNRRCYNYWNSYQLGFTSGFTGVSPGIRMAREEISEPSSQAFIRQLGHGGVGSVRLTMTTRFEDNDPVALIISHTGTTGRDSLLAAHHQNQIMVHQFNGLDVGGSLLSTQSRPTKLWVTAAYPGETVLIPNSGLKLTWHEVIEQSCTTSSGCSGDTFFCWDGFCRDTRLNYVCERYRDQNTDDGLTWSAGLPVLRTQGTFKCTLGRLCTVPSISTEAGAASWTGQDCGPGGTVSVGTTCTIVPQTGFVCTDPGLCGETGQFAATASCEAVARCNSFLSCPENTENKGQDVLCTGNTATCNSATCCQAVTVSVTGQCSVACEGDFRNCIGFGKTYAQCSADLGLADSYLVQQNNCVQGCTQTTDMLNRANPRLLAGNTKPSLPESVHMENPRLLAGNTKPSLPESVHMEAQTPAPTAERRMNAECTVPTISPGQGAASFAGHENCSSGANVPHGQSCTITPASGFTCTNPGLCTDGTFASSATCLAKCTVPSISNGAATCSGEVNHGDSCTFNPASSGYTCISPGLCTNGVFAEPSAACSAKCTAPSISNGVLSCSGQVNHGDSCTITANSGFTCTAPGLCTDGTFANPTATCSADCTVPTISGTHGVVSGHARCESAATDVPHGAICTITAASGYTCTSPGLCTNGAFAVAPATCSEITCTLPTIPPENGAQSWSGHANCASGAQNVPKDGTGNCSITAALGFTCTNPGMCGEDGNFAVRASCTNQAQCYNDLEYSGASLHDAATPSDKDCQKLCMEADECAYFTFKTGTGAGCYFSSTPGTTTCTASSCSSGPKYCVRAKCKDAALIITCPANHGLKTADDALCPGPICLVSDSSVCCQPTSLTTDGVEARCYNDLVYSGGTIDTGTLSPDPDTAKKCQLECQKHPLCAYFSYLVGGEAPGCQLKTSATVRSGSATVCSATTCKSGPKFCGQIIEAVVLICQAGAPEQQHLPCLLEGETEQTNIVPYYPPIQSIQEWDSSIQSSVGVASHETDGDNKAIVAIGCNQALCAEMRVGYSTAYLAAGLGAIELESDARHQEDAEPPPLPIGEKNCPAGYGVFSVRCNDLTCAYPAFKCAKPKGGVLNSKSTDLGVMPWSPDEIHGTQDTYCPRASVLTGFVCGGTKCWKKKPICAEFKPDVAWQDGGERQVDESCGLRLFSCVNAELQCGLDECGVACGEYQGGCPDVLLQLVSRMQFDEPMCFPGAGVCVFTGIPSAVITWMETMPAEIALTGSDEYHWIATALECIDADANSCGNLKLFRLGLKVESRDWHTFSKWISDFDFPDTEPILGSLDQEEDYAAECPPPSVVASIECSDVEAGCVALRLTCAKPLSFIWSDTDLANYGAVTTSEEGFRKSECPKHDPTKVYAMTGVECKRTKCAQVKVTCRELRPLHVGRLVEGVATIEEVESSLVNSGEDIAAAIHSTLPVLSVPAALLVSGLSL